MDKSIYPEGYHAIMPILRVDDAAAAMGFFTDAFGATEDFRREAKGRLLLAVMKIGDSRIMVFDGASDPDQATGGDPRGNGLMLKLYVADADRAFAAALEQGAVENEPVADRYFGERSGILTDPFGFSWQVAEFQEELGHDVIEKRMHAAMDQ
ncbi:VOC family protein [Sphingosinicella sp. LHD-64]|uniref:VOC family protein n=1 Tax=Sphingosinicella sp. LHD-64 TaxID=3072139 RepID=UPI00280D9495|nr:VOC family protein [Sphingosinicella sp. LHD-64]MDQ8756723.1 VOC family protein [Sphingosinicella sp. LHD-64]